MLPNDRPRPDPALYRITGLVALIGAMIATVWSSYFAFVQAPSLVSMLQDFEASVSHVSRIVLLYPWLPLIGAPLVFVGALLATLWPRPLALALAHALVYVLLAATTLFAMAAWAPFAALCRSISG
jgi:hypothetical protein